MIDNNTWVIAHGGGQEIFPANTMVAFDGSVEMGVDALEMDLRLSKDNVLVAHHDETIDRLSNGSGKITDFTYDELQNYNFASKFVDIHGHKPYQDTLIQIPALSEVFMSYPMIYMIIEIKDGGDRGERSARELLKLIYQYSMQDRVIVASFHHDVLKHFYKISKGEIPISSSKKESTKFVISSKIFMNILYFPKAVAIQIPVNLKKLNLKSQTIINSAHKHKMAIHYWTINSKEEMETLIEMNVDGIITDRPDLMIELLEEMGCK